MAATQLNLASAEGRARRREQLAKRDERTAEYLKALRQRLAQGRGWSQGERFHGRRKGAW